LDDYLRALQEGEKKDASSAAAQATALELVITRTFDAPRALVFACWTEQEHQARWMAPGRFTSLGGEADFRVGGRWRAGMLSPEGKELWVGGVYREIAPPELLVFTHRWEEAIAVETVVTVRLTERGGKTEMQFHQTGFRSVETRDGHRGGWSEAFDNLAEHLRLSQNSVAKPA
jgi:uncharacterized protein YndB with AHSA1/START domain